MKKKIVCFALCFCAVFFAAACKKDGSVLASASRPPAFYGVYEGVLPAADGPGIHTTLTLNRDGTFTEKSEYLERDFTAEDKGSFTRRGDRLKTVTEQGDAVYYRLQSGSVRRLDGRGNAVEGPLADYYVLRQTRVF